MAAANQVNQYLGQAVNNHQALSAQFVSLFPEIAALKTIPEQINAVAALAQTDPQRHAAAVQLITQGNQLAQTIQDGNLYVQSVNQKAFNSWAHEQDKAFEKSHPEVYANPDIADKAQRAALQVLREAGLSQQEIEHHWNTTGMLRDARVQNMLLENVR